MSLSKDLAPVARQFSTIATKSNSGLIYQAEVSFLQAQVERNASIGKCSVDSLREVLRQSAATGLTLNPAKQHAAVIPRAIRDKDTNKVIGHEASLMPMYRGLLYLAHQSGVLQNYACECVFESDRFDMRMGTSPEINHVIDVKAPRNNPEGGENRFIGAYVIAWFKDARVPHITWMPAEDVLRARNASDSYRWYDKATRSWKVSPKSPWVLWFTEMAKKAALKRAQKLWQRDEIVLDPRIAKAIALDDAHYIEPRDTDLPGQVTITEAQRVSIEAKIEEVGFDKVAVCSAYEIGSLAEIPADKFEEVMTRLETFGERRRERQAG